jgi:hypothetical protein
MNSKSYKKWKREFFKEKKIDSMCKNEIDRKIFDIFDRTNSGYSIPEFYVFKSGFIQCLNLSDQEIHKLKELKTEL